MKNLRPSDLRYDGAFLLPRGRFSGKHPASPHARWGYGLQSIAYFPGADTILGTGHRHGMRVGSFRPPDVEELGDARHTDSFEGYQLLPRATQVENIEEVAGGLKEDRRKRNLTRLGGLTVEDDLFLSFYTYYAVQPFELLDVASFCTMKVTDVGRVGAASSGLFRVGTFGDRSTSQKRTSKYLLTVPKEIAGGLSIGSVACGKADGAGNVGNSRGPALHVFDPTGGAMVSRHSGEVEFASVETLLEYPKPYEMEDWSPCDQWQGAAWIQDGDRTAVVFAGRRGLGPTRYGKPLPENASTGKGYHCDPYGAELVFYSTFDLQEVRLGLAKPWQPRPYARLDLVPYLFGQMLPENRQTFSLGGLAYDWDEGRLWIVESNKEEPIVHQFFISAEEEEEDEEEDEEETPKEVTVTVMIGDKTYAGGLEAIE